jgi:predicted PurR-regulated permease PerM
MTINQPNQPPPNPSPLQSKVERSSQAWRRLWMNIRSITPSGLGRALLVLTAMAGLAWLAVASWPALLPFIVGGVLAYIFLPLVDVLDWIMPRFLAALITMLLILFGIAGLIYVLVPPLINQVVILLQQIPPDLTIKDVSRQLIDAIQTLPPSARSFLANAILSATDRINTNINSVAPSLFSPTTILSFLNALGFILGLVVLPTWLMTVLKDKPRGSRSLDKLLPDTIRADFWAVLRIFDRSFGTFFRGQILVGILVGLVTYAGLRLMVLLGAPNSPYFVLLAVLAGLFQLIPEVGPIVNTILVVLLAYRINPMLALYVLGLYIAIQFILGSFLKGRIEESIIDLNPALLVLFMVALSQLGAFWLFLAAPVAGLSRDLFRYAYGRLGDPPRPAGLLPGEKLRVVSPAAAKAKRRAPLIYRRNQKPNSQP